MRATTLRRAVAAALFAGLAVAGAAAAGPDLPDLPSCKWVYSDPPAQHQLPGVPPVPRTPSLVCYG